MTAAPLRCFLKDLEGNTVQVEIRHMPEGFPKLIYFNGMFFVLEEEIVDHAWYRQMIAVCPEEVI